MFCKAGFLIKNSDELELSDEQVDQIKKLKMETKKEVIRDQAEVDLIKVDIKSKMWDDPVDVKAIDKLIDKKYDIKKKKAKALIGAYAQLQGILSDKQKDAAKALWKSCKCKKAQ